MFKIIEEIDKRLSFIENEFLKTYVSAFIFISLWMVVWFSFVALVRIYGQ